MNARPSMGVALFVWCCLILAFAFFLIRLIGW